MRESGPDRKPHAVIVAAARACIGTRWHHQGRVPGAGLDCVGLVVHAIRAAGVAFADTTDYGRRHDNGRLLRELDARLARASVADLQPGDVLAFSWSERDSESQHVAIVTESQPLTIVHAHLGQRGVVEHPAGQYWTGRIAAAYRVRCEA